jgi:hypothetical protein
VEEQKHMDNLERLPEWLAEGIAVSVTPEVEFGTLPPGFRSPGPRGSSSPQPKPD